jgi:hypothetical protein
MVYQTPYQWYFHPLPMVHQTPYRWYIEPPLLVLWTQFMVQNTMTEIWPSGQNIIWYIDPRVDFSGVQNTI